MATFTNTTKNSSTFSNTTKNSASMSNISKSTNITGYILRQALGQLLRENGYSLLREGYVNTTAVFSNQVKN